MSLLESRVVGSRVATQVRITAPGAFEGMRGYVVRVHHPGSISVRLTHTKGEKRWNNIALPFGANEIEEIEELPPHAG